MPKPKTILLVKNRALGDSIMGLSAVLYLKDINRKANIIYAVPEWIAPLYNNIQTAADKIYPLKLKNVFDIIKLCRDIKKLKIDHIHEMHQSGRGALIFKWVSFFFDIPYTAHNHHLKVGTKVLDQEKILPLIQRDLNGVFSFLGGDQKKPHYLDFEPKINLIDKVEKSLSIIMGVVATRATKMWPLENYLELAELILKKYPKYSILIPLSKSKDDEIIKNKLIAIGFSKKIFIHQWSLEQLPYEFKKASFYIGNDTGLKHLAVAVGLKTYTFFGPEPANEWHPYDSNRHPYFYQENLLCRTRTHHYCGLSVCDLKNIEEMKCVKTFLVQDVFLKIESAIDKID